MTWAIGIALVAVGGLLLVISLYVNTLQLIDCLRTRSIARTSSFMLSGPTLITLGYIVAPITGWAWAVAVPWAVELVLLLTLWSAFRGLNAKVRDSPNLVGEQNDV